jgi:hypothetical protein
MESLPSAGLKVAGENKDGGLVDALETARVPVPAMETSRSAIAAAMRNNVRVSIRQQAREKVNRMNHELVRA